MADTEDAHAAAAAAAAAAVDDDDSDDDDGGGGGGRLMENVLEDADDKSHDSSRWDNSFIRGVPIQTEIAIWPPKPEIVYIVLLRLSIFSAVMLKYGIEYIKSCSFSSNENISVTFSRTVENLSLQVLKI